jgi:hypothetical protein
MDLDVTRDIFATDENSVTSREGSLNGTKMTSSIVSYEEVKKHQVAKNQACTQECGLLQVVEEL